MSLFFFFSSRRRHTRCGRDWSSDVCSSDLGWAPEMLNADLGPWPQAVRDYLTTGNPTGYRDIEDEIGVTKPQNHLETAFGQALHAALLAAAPAGLTVA